jgi:hypothetical protein
VTSNDDNLPVVYRAPQTPHELLAQLELYFGLRYPRKACCPDHTSPADAIIEAYFAKSPIIIWIASRGFGGKTWALAGLSLIELISGFDVVLAGGSGEQSRRAHEAAEKAWGHSAEETVDGKLEAVTAPHWLLANEPRRTWTRTLMGNTMQALTASSRAARGPHPQRLRIDEAEECDVEIIDALMGQTMVTDPRRPAQTILASTHHHEAGTMTELLKRAAEKGWPVRRWCYKETLCNPKNPGSWLLPENIASKRIQVTGRMWRTEYDLEAPDEGGMLFAREALEAMFSGAPVDDGLNQVCLFEDPVDGGDYVVAADWARKVDLSVVAVVRYDVTPPRLVRWVRCFRWPWPKVVKLYNEWGKEYHAHAIHDATGIGDVINTYLDIPISQVTPYIMTPASKVKLYLDYETAVDNGEVEWPALNSLTELHRAVTTDDLYGSGHPPDEICTLALAWQIAGGKRTISRLHRPRGL